jgi:hypothetical protein
MAGTVTLDSGILDKVPAYSRRRVAQSARNVIRKLYRHFNHSGTRKYTIIATVQPTSDFARPLLGKRFVRHCEFLPPRTRIGLRGAP